jgi:hypothetical protein
LRRCINHIQIKIQSSMGNVWKFFIIFFLIWNYIFCDLIESYPMAMGAYIILTDSLASIEGLKSTRISFRMNDILFRTRRSLVLGFKTKLDWPLWTRLTFTLAQGLLTAPGCRDRSWQVKKGYIVNAHYGCVKAHFRILKGHGFALV